MDTQKTFGAVATADNLKSRAEATAAIAAANADAVDYGARFPVEAIATARANGLLGMLVPSDLGGESASIADMVDVCYLLGRSCASTGMIFAMHQIMVAILLLHGRKTEWHRRMLQRLCKEQLLLASSTTENQRGGDLRSSDCAVHRTGSRVTLSKKATVVSYGTQADVILTTARRSEESLPSDQVLVVFSKDDYELEPIIEWEALGMRGTCSGGFILKAQGGVDQVLPEPYQTIQARTMMPVAHLAWSAVWAGLASGAVERARRFVRAASRRTPGELPAGASHLTRATMSLGSLRALVASRLGTFETAAGEPEKLESLGFQSAMNLLKVNASELAIATVMSAMQVCGLAGYRNKGEFSVSRYVRDVLSSSVMINNDRILASAALASFLIEIPSRLKD